MSCTVDAPCFGRPVRLIWRKRRWCRAEAACPVKTFTEQDEQIARPRALLTPRACWWAINQLRREHASIRGIARQLGTTSNTVWGSIRPLLAAMADDEARFAGVARLGVDEHVWHHVSTRPIEGGGRGPKGADRDGRPDPRRRRQHEGTTARPGPCRSGKAYSDWLEQRGQTFRDGVQVATLDPFHGYKNAIDDQLQDATAVLDAFHLVKLGTAAVDEVRRRVQQAIHGHRGRKNDPLYAIRTILRCGAEKLTDRQHARLDKAIAADERHDEVSIAWQCAQQLRSAYKAKNPVEGRRTAEKLLASLPTCPIPQIKRLGKTLKQRREAFPATSTPDARPTAPLTPSTASSSSTAETPAASATANTTDCACSSSAAA